MNTGALVPDWPAGTREAILRAGAPMEAIPHILTLADIVLVEIAGNDTPAQSQIRSEIVRMEASAQKLLSRLESMHDETATALTIASYAIGRRGPFSASSIAAIRDIADTLAVAGRSLEPKAGRPSCAYGWFVRGVARQLEQFGQAASAAPNRPLVKVIEAIFTIRGIKGRGGHDIPNVRTIVRAALGGGENPSRK